MTYFKDIEEYNVLDEDKLKSLFMKHDDISRDIIIKHNLKLVVKIATSFMGCGLPFEDLISSGNIGLMKAVDKFDIDNGGLFSSYASLWIKAEIKRSLDKCHVVFHGSYMRQKDKPYYEVRLDAPLDEEDQKTTLYDVFGEQINPFSENEKREELKRLVENMKSILNEIEYLIISKRYMAEEKETFRSLAKKIKSSPQRCEQIEKTALKKLRMFMEE